MLTNIPSYILYLIAFIVSAIISWYAVRKVIFITRRRKLYDIPDNIRKIHGAEIPSLGGIGIFIGYVIPCVFFLSHEWLYVLAASILLFFTGVYDDLMNMRPSKKLIAQLLAAAVAVYFGDIRITSLHGLLGIGEMHYLISIVLAVICCTFFINAFNFVDGIDGLACTLAILYTGLFGALFAIYGYTNLACIALCLTGATAGLLLFNRPPAKIYMGDTGSMLLGFSIFMLSLLFLKQIDEFEWHHSKSGMMLFVLSILFLPVYDALRVFILRASKGISPLKADRTHLHYYMLDAGFTHAQAALSILAVNIILIGAGYFLQDAYPLFVILGLFLITTLFLLIIYGLRHRRMKAVI